MHKKTVNNLIGSIAAFSLVFTALAIKVNTQPTTTSLASNSSSHTNNLASANTVHANRENTNADIIVGAHTATIRRTNYSE